MRYYFDKTWKQDNNLREDVRECLVDPVFDIIKNFSLQKSKDFYSKWDEAWENGMYSDNPAAKKEEEVFEYKGLDELIEVSKEAKTFYNNLKDMPFCKNVRYEVGVNKIVVYWRRLKTFDEWLHDGLKDAIVEAIECPEDGARQIIERKLGKGIYSNTAIHMFAEGELNEADLKRLGTYEKYVNIENRDIEEDIKQAITALKDMEENNKITLLDLNK